MNDTHNISSHDTENSANVGKIDPGTWHPIEVMLTRATLLGKTHFWAKHPYDTQKAKLNNKSCHEGMKSVGGDKAARFSCCIYIHFKFVGWHCSNHNLHVVDQQSEITS